MARTKTAAVAEKNSSLDTFLSRFEGQTLWHLVVLVLLPFFLYIKVTGFEFINMDDTAIITNNFDILLHLKNIGIAFKTDAFLSAHGDFYRPVQTVSFFIDAAIGGEKPWIYHLTSLIYHLLTVISLYFFLRFLGFRNLIAVLCALIFSVHPVLSSAVSWIPARGDVLIGLFGVLLFLTYGKFIRTGNWLYFICHAIVFALAMFTKETSLLFPVLLLLYHKFILHQSFRLKQLLPFLLWWILIAALYFFLRTKVVSGTPPDFIFGVGPFIKNLADIPVNIAKLILPFQLSTLPLFDPIYTMIGVLFLFIIAVLVIIAIRKKQWLAVLGFAWFIFFIVPPMFFKLYYSKYLLEYYEHRAYLPYIGMIILIAYLFDSIQRKANSNKWIWIAAAFILVFIPLASLHADDFKTSAKFFTNAAERNNPGAYTKRGEQYYAERDYQNALNDFNTALDVSANEYAPAFYNRGKLKAEVMKDRAGAVQDLSMALQIDTFYIEAYIERAAQRIFVQDYQGSYYDIQKAKQLDSNNAKIYFTLGDLYVNAAKFPEAIESFTRSIKLNPDYAEAYNNRGFSYYKLHDYANALKDCSKATEIFPVYLNAFYNKGMIHLETGKTDVAISTFDTTIQLANNFYFAYFYRGMAKKQKKDMIGACNDWQESVKLGFSMAQDTIRKYCKP
jgi:tetratricopeptide (TPR) repeat protein